MQQPHTPASHGSTAFAVAGRVAAWVIAAAVIVLVVLAVTVQARSADGVALVGYANMSTVLNPLISAFVGAVVIDRKGNHPVGWLFCLSGLGWALYQVGFAVGFWMAPGDVPAWELLVWSTGWSAFLGFGLTPVLVLYLFPDGRVGARRWRIPFAIAVAAVVLGAVSYAFAPGPLEDLPELRNPYGVSGGLGTVLSVGVELAWPLLLLSIAGGVLSLRHRVRRASFDQRQQIKWVLLAGAVLFAFVCFWGITELLGRTEIAAAAAGLFLPLLPIALGTAILRHRLYDIDVLINRTLVYALLSAVLAAVYLGAVFVFSRVLAPFAGGSNLAVAASTLAVAALFRPLRTRIQSFIDRRFYRAKYDAVATLGRFSTRLRHEVDLDALEGELLEVVAATVQPRTAGLWLKGT
jgi:hypothetical protein